MTTTPTPTTQPLAVSAKELATMLCVSVRKIRQLDSSGHLPRAVTIGAASKRWPVATILAWLQADCPDRKTFEAIRKNGRASP